MDNNLQIKEGAGVWKNGRAKTITFIVTKDCQLACKYCYLVGKNSKERMSWEVAKLAIDYILSHETDFDEENVTWDFIGGEPFLEINLIDKICDYLKTEMFSRNHHWFNSYRFSFSTNGINYHTEKVQSFIKKNREHLSIGITIDGTQRKHDLNRIWKTPEIEQGITSKPEEERGSYADVVRNIPLWLMQFPGGTTKVTISSADIPYIKESVLHLYSLGIHEVNINCVFEDAWKEGDDLQFEEQLIELADAIIDEGYYKDYACSFFTEYMGKPLDCKLQNQNWCGAGMMLSIDAAGNFYPCTRFAQYSLREKKAWIIGNVRDGIDKNKLRPFLTLDRCTQSSQECIDCEVAEGCAWCQGENYDAAETPTAYQRATAICKMHKARVRANNYYWNKLYRKLELEGIAKEEAEKHVKKSNPEIC
ncbi:MAG: radical SAM peptide maturase, CXXX-repeat target family [Paraprevotella sp.]|nr:radical SAM peptide maturase, CXXX-repeat target family [Paraprevotella sp.]